VPYIVSLAEAQKKFPNFSFVHALTPSEQKCAFHVTDAQGRHLCLKMIAPSYEPERLNREIAALQLISHPNIVHLDEYVFSTKNGEQLHYLVEDYIDGKDLSDHLIPGVQWSAQRAAKFFASLFGGLAALRNAGVVHRDLKPANIRVRLNDEPVIIDFGVARHLGLPDITKTSIGGAIGTPAFFAPEQWEGSRRDIDYRTDFFAAGILLYQALLGRHPFLESHFKVLAELRDAVCFSDAATKAGDFLSLPSSWRTLLTSLIGKRREMRPASADLVVRLLLKFGSEK
jgi:serine/threonine protein kinase